MIPECRHPLAVTCNTRAARDSLRCGDSFGRSLGKIDRLREKHLSGVYSRQTPVVDRLARQPGQGDFDVASSLQQGKPAWFTAGNFLHPLHGYRNMAGRGSSKLPRFARLGGLGIGPYEAGRLGTTDSNRDRFASRGADRWPMFTGAGAIRATVPAIRASHSTGRDSWGGCGCLLGLQKEPRIDVSPEATRNAMRLDLLSSQSFTRAPPFSGAGATRGSCSAHSANSGLYSASSSSSPSSSRILSARRCVTLYFKRYNWAGSIPTWAQTSSGDRSSRA
jgi:hypothetical protein